MGCRVMADGQVAESATATPKSSKILIFPDSATADSAYPEAEIHRALSPIPTVPVEFGKAMRSSPVPYHSMVSVQSEATSEAVEPEINTEG